MTASILFAEDDAMKVIQKVGKRRAIVIPRELCDEVGLQEGDFIELQVIDGTVVIKPKRLVDAREAPPVQGTTLNSA